jgi:hypothetical protein
MAHSHGGVSFSLDEKLKKDWKLETSPMQPSCSIRSGAVASPREVPGVYWNLYATTGACELIDKTGTIAVQASTGPTSIVWRSTATYNHGGFFTNGNHAGSSRNCFIAVCVSKADQQRLESLEQSGAQFDVQPIDNNAQK